MNSEASHVECIVVAPSSALLFKRNPFPELRLIAANIGRKNIVCLLSMIRILREEIPDIVITHSSTDSWLVQVARIFVHRKFGCIRVRHVSAPICANFATKWMYQRFDAVITTSDAIKRNIVDLGLPEKRVFSIPTGLDTNAWKLRTNDEYEAQRAKLMNWGGVGSLGFFITMVSTLRSWKGHEIAIRAVAEVEGVFLNIIGDGPQEIRLKKIVGELNVENRVKFWGYQSDVSDYLKASDLFLQPSLNNEGVSQSLLQAQAIGVPVVASNIGGLNQVVVHDQTGFLVFPGNVDSIKDAICAIKKGSCQVERWIESARRNIERDGSLEVMAVKTLEVFDFVSKGDLAC